MTADVCAKVVPAYEAQVAEENEMQLGGHQEHEAVEVEALTC